MSSVDFSKRIERLEHQVAELAKRAADQDKDIGATLTGVVAILATGLEPTEPAARDAFRAYMHLALTTFAPPGPLGRKMRDALIQRIGVPDQQHASPYPGGSNGQWSENGQGRQAMR